MQKGGLKFLSQSQIHSLWSSVTYVLALILAGCSAEQDRSALALPDYPGVKAAMEVKPGASCPDVLPVTVQGKNEAALRDGKLIPKVVEWAKFMAQMNCREAAMIRVSGAVDGRVVYEAIAHRATNWTLTEAPVGKVNEVLAKLSAQVLSIRQCDERGAHPADPEAVAKGVADDQLDAQAVIAACVEAIKFAQHTPRVQFQLARGYFKADRFETAIEHLVTAAELEHGGALALLGDIYLGGAPGIDADPGIARSLYEKALRSGFAPAKAVFDQFGDWSVQLAQAEAEEK